jgi:photosystem II stability/assembly factor-like uncharacterized protein
MNDTARKVLVHKRLILTILLPALLLLAFVSYGADSSIAPANKTDVSAREPGQAASQTSPTWEIQKSGTDASLRGVSVVDDRTAWASGSKGTVLRTVDGGKTWRAAKIPGAETLDFRDIEAFGADTAYVLAIGRPAKIFKTENGGESWTEQYTDDRPGIFLDALAFFDENNGLALGDPIEGRFVLISTSFGGRLWHSLPEAGRPAAEKGEGAFAASGTSLIFKDGYEIWFCTGGPVSRLFHSRDSGRTWESRPSPLLSGQASYGTFSLAFGDDANGIIVGGDYKDESAAVKNAAFTTDGGATWSLCPGKPPAGFRECVAFVPGTNPAVKGRAFGSPLARRFYPRASTAEVDPRAKPGAPAAVAVTVGPSGSDFSLDMGKSWIPIAGPAGFHSVGFARNGSAGWAVGKGGLIAKFLMK